MTFYPGHPNYFTSHTVATRQRLSSQRFGELNPNWRGGGVEVRCAQCQKHFKTYKPARLFCSRACANTNPEVSDKRSEAQRLRKGPAAANWLGGITPANRLARKTAEYKAWRTAVFERDDYTCQSCGARGVELHADHIRPFSRFPELRLNLENGRTLCVPCHRLTDTYCGRARKSS